MLCMFQKIWWIILQGLDMFQEGISICMNVCAYHRFLGHYRLHSHQLPSCQLILSWNRSKPFRACNIIYQATNSLFSVPSSLLLSSTYFLRLKVSVELIQYYHSIHEMVGCSCSSFLSQQQALLLSLERLDQPHWNLQSKKVSREEQERRREQKRES